MFPRIPIAALIAVLLTPALAPAADNDTIQKLRQEIEQLKQSDEARLQALELRSQQTAALPTSQSNSFNPAVSLILSGVYAHLSQNPAHYRISGFPVPTDTDIGPGQRGFSLAESELGLYANVDPYFYGGLNFAIHPDNTASAEEAFVQTSALAHGLTIKFGRFFSGIGYLNEQHAHVWDFADAPLAYQAFLGGQYGDDGVQLRWLAPLDQFLEFGAELGRGRNFPGSNRDSNSAGAYSAFVHSGGDVGDSHSWRAGLSALASAPHDQALNDVNAGGTDVQNAFSGDTRIAILDFVWRYAPHGNATRSNFKLQGELLWRRQDGRLVYDVTGPASSANFTARQYGGYLQALYQFHPYWRVGVRTDFMDGGRIDYGTNSASMPAPGYDPSRNSIMLDYNLSEFSRLRLQYARDRTTADATDNQVFIQYQMSLGAHGAHNF